MHQPENFDRVWVMGERPTGPKGIPEVEAMQYPYTGGRSVFQRIGRFTIHISHDASGRHLWAGIHNGPGVLIWDPGDELSQCIRPEEARELKEELDRALVLMDLAGVEEP